MLARFILHMSIGKVWICRLLLVCVRVCKVTDFVAEDKASGVIFCSAVHRRPEQGGITNFCELCSREAQNRTNRRRAGHAHPHVNITVEMCGRKCHARDTPFVKSSVWT